ncbi:MAG: hypothetical protein H7334_12755 [Ferruginibacter sp.]|nr:hypothetical protein [Ferruginibacter sp.]
MVQTYIYSGITFIVGFGIAWLIRTVAMAKVKKSLKSTQGYLESEVLKKETLQKENIQVYELKQVTEHDCLKKLQQSKELIKRLDADILLLQKSNEETEALLEAGQPALHSLKLQFIEAQNIIARYKAQQHPAANRA